MKNWLLAARPKTLPAAIVPVWSGCVLAWKLQGSWNPWLAFCTLAAALCIQIATNFFNDAIDARKGADTEKRLGPRRVTACGLIPRRTVLIAATFFLGLAAIFGMILFRKAGWPVIWIGLPSLYFAYGYTGGPLPLAYKGLGELFVVIFFGLVAVGGTILIQTGEWRNEAMLLGLQIGLLSAVLISINNLRDREEDSGTGKMTLAVRMGERGARVLVWLEVKAAAFAGLLWLKYQLPWLVLATIPLWTLGMYLLFRVFNDPIGHAMNRLLALAGLMLLLFAACFHAAAGIN
ncbi:MAG: 1,4-dihydroxy-2-naphthoate polyprenyltransferase [Verrucomicrobia bacterium]|nr:1,4-dihydroxy-2-naphthoate polyprenyltransferase [Verrucomicrobiota bacterium]